jgi:allophanate hydrolase subunit 1
VATAAQPQCLMQPGDAVRFVRITPEQFHAFGTGP